MVKRNVDIRYAAKEAGVMLWEIAERCGMQDSNFSRKLRRELPESEKDKIYTIIEDIKAEREAER